MDAYSEDLRQKIVQALQQRRMNNSEAARTFGVSLSSVKRYAKAAREGRSLSPGKAPGKRPLLDEKARRLLEADLKERPFAKLSDRQEYLQKVAGVSVSESTLSRTIRKMGFGRKKDAGCKRARRVLESGFSRNGDLLDRAESLRIRG
jgi:transposase